MTKRLRLQRIFKKLNEVKKEPLTVYIANWKSGVRELVPIQFPAQKEGFK